MGGERRRKPQALDMTYEPPRSDMGGSAPRARRSALALAAVIVLGAGATARAEDTVPRVSPDRIEDVPSTKPDPFPAFDNFAWRAFVALNWPASRDAGHRGEPDRAKGLGDSGPRVWETFKARYELFARGPGGGPIAPTPWASTGGPNPCGASADARVKTLAAFDPFADFNQASFSPGRPMNVLVAQNRTYVRYEVRVNRTEYDSIVAHGWEFGRSLPTAEAPGGVDVGAVAVKAAWRLLTAQDTPEIRKRSYVVEGAEVTDVAKSLAAHRTVCAKQDIALVGLHIAVKTKYRPQWIWSTFEHVDNVPPVGVGDAREPDAIVAGAPYSFNDPAKGQKDVAPPADSPPAWPVDAGNPPRVDPEPMQVIRKHAINAQTMAMNRAYWALPEIRGTVWANYMLVATQWPTVTQPPSPDNDGRYFPGVRIESGTPAEPYQTGADGGDPDQNLVNTTMETYAQDSPSSCMACHNAVSNVRGRDFVAILPEGPVKAR